MDKNVFNQIKPFVYAKILIIFWIEVIIQNY